ncbi:MAG: phage integrase N-terminal SAM-like domain-containing protein, partial [Aequorivita sp.]
MKPHENHTVIMYRPKANAGRIKFFIPYPLKNEREAFKKLNTSFYHHNQKLWSLVNTPANITLVKELFRDKMKIVDADPIPKIPKVILSEKIQEELDANHQKMVLKGFSNSTIQNYQHALGQFFSYFEMADYKAVSKDQIEGFVYHLISKYKISEQKQNLIINAIK